MGDPKKKEEAALQPVTKAEVVELVDGRLGRFKDRPTKAAVNQRFEELTQELSGQGELVAEIQGRLDSLATTMEAAAEATDPSAIQAYKEVIELRIREIEGTVDNAITRAERAEASAAAALHRADYLQHRLGVRPEDEELARTAIMAPVRFVNMQPRLRHGLEFALGAGAWLLIARLLETRFALPTGWVAILLAGATGVALGETAIVGGQVLFASIQNYRQNRQVIEGRTV